MTDELTVGSESTPSGIQIYDDVDGKPYCVYIDKGNLIEREGVCENMSPVTEEVNTPPTEQIPVVVDTPEGTESSNGTDSPAEAEAEGADLPAQSGEGTNETGDSEDTTTEETNATQENTDPNSPTETETEEGASEQNPDPILDVVDATPTNETEGEPVASGNQTSPTT
jgi:hypothetical protein